MRATAVGRAAGPHAVGAGRGRRRRRPGPRGAPCALLGLPGVGGGGDVGGLLAAVAEVALKSRLRTWTSVTPEVRANVGDVMQGRVAGVTIRGRGWCSPLGLSCRTLAVAVPGGAGIDVEALFARQRILLRAPAVGDGVVEMDAQDFEAFLAHPGMPSPGAGLAFRTGQGARCEVDPDRGVVRFSCVVLADGRTVRCELAPAPSPASANGRILPPSVRVVLDGGGGGGSGSAQGAAAADGAGIGDRLGRFFADLVFELDGTFLQFRRLAVAPGSRTIRLDVSVRVEKFPSPGLEF